MLDLITQWEQAIDEVIDVMGRAANERAEVSIPAYEALRKDGKLADRMLSILIRGVSTRKYREVL
jgi:hypothetical protein